MKRRLMIVILVVALSLAGIIAMSLTGCATGPAATPPAQTMPEMLTAAGFKTYPANTPQKMTYLQTCPRDLLMIHKRAGATAYCFVDPASSSMYMGDEAAYGRLQGLLNQQQQRIREQSIENDPQFWPLWMDQQGGG